MIPVNNGLYIISGDYFADYPDPYLKGNDGENRPACFCVKSKVKGIYWMVPLSHRVQKYKDIISKREASGKQCDICHIVKIGKDESAFVIADMFPVTENYIKRPYTISGTPVILFDKKDIDTIGKKARKILALLEGGIVLNKMQPDVRSIEKSLVETLED